MLSFVIFGIVCAIFDALYVIHSLKSNKKAAGMGAIILFSLVCAASGAFVIFMK